MNEWKPKYWERNGWRKADGSAVVNRRDFEELDEAAGDMEVRYVSTNARAVKPGPIRGYLTVRLLGINGS